MKLLATSLSIALSLASLPGACQSFPSSENYSYNPMHGVGVAHNAYAGCLIVNYAGGGELALADSLVRKCGARKDEDAEEFVREYAQIAGSLRPDPRLTLADNLRSLHSRFDPAQFAYFEDIDRVFAGAVDPEAASRELKALEAKAIGQLGRSDGDLEVLAAIATARYSLELWSRQRPLVTTAGRSFPWEVVAADVAGLLLGNAACGRECGVLVSTVFSAVAALQDLQQPDTSAR
ncbi:hypothetical protein ABU614_08645 [Lysobacter firmicutimachus]|uniref:DUF3015 domain-containing protein n=1 Tax=Lysobacter firmicutimachus TaxID=1792846 RepID=A0AAU8N014_9GAMM